MSFYMSIPSHDHIQYLNPAIWAGEKMIAVPHCGTAGTVHIPEMNRVELCRTVGMGMFIEAG